MSFVADRGFVAVFILVIAVGLVLQIAAQRRSGRWPPGRMLTIAWGATALGLAILLIGWLIGS